MTALGADSPLAWQLTNAENCAEADLRANPDTQPPNFAPLETVAGAFKSSLGRIIGSTGRAKPRDLILPRIQRCTILHIRELADHLT